MVSVVREMECGERRLRRDQSRQCEGGELYVAEKGQLTLGWPHIKKLGMKIDSTRLAPVYTVLEHDLQQELIYDELDKNFPAVFSESLGLEERVLMDVQRSVMDVPDVLDGNVQGEDGGSENDLLGGRRVASSVECRMVSVVREMECGERRLRQDQVRSGDASGVAGTAYICTLQEDQ
ncbi:hypothetical protein NDU88_002967 [Pleurodeles waltl]|uniref:Uncharacterized protein n=1 Tax=Pleurodeles waltl TaxID=8319 RepID=A0AAV7P8H4_PLEWA|nr:hypothetical protein NDU88_002967 [Pleurodeles waltl]